MEIGARLKIPEVEVLDHIAELKRRYVVREINAIFNTRRLGYKTVLTATRFEPHKLDEAAQVISEATSISGYRLLYSTREYKKTRVRYFV